MTKLLVLLNNQILISQIEEVTSELGVNAGMTDGTSTWNAAKFRCVLSVTGGANVTSGVVTLTIT